MRLLGIAMVVTGLASGTGCVHGGLTNQSKSPQDVAAEQGSTADIPPKKSAALCLKMAEELERAGKDSEAILYYEQARQNDPAVADRAARRLAILYDLTGNQPKAMTEFQALLKKKPKDSSLLNDIGYSCYNRGQWAEAEGFLRRSVTADPKNTYAWSNLGLTLAQLGRTNESLEAFMKAVSPAEAYQNLGFVFATQGNREAALEAYRKSLEIEPTSQSARAAAARLERGLVPDQKQVLQPAGAGLVPDQKSVSQPVGGGGS